MWRAQFRYNAYVDQLTVMFSGPQGSGKGTQITKLTDYLTQKDTRKVVSFGMGKALREFAAKGGYTGDQVAESLARGELQPLFLASALLAEYFVEHLEGKEHLIVDGFPRQENQLAVYDSAIQFYKRLSPTILNVVISDDVAVERLLKRGRNDDTPEGIKKRLAWSSGHTKPVLEWFRKNPYYRVIDVDGERSIDEIHQDILNKLGLV